MTKIKLTFSAEEPNPRGVDQHRVQGVGQGHSARQAQEKRICPHRIHHGLEQGP